MCYSPKERVGFPLSNCRIQAIFGTVSLHNEKEISSRSRGFYLHCFLQWQNKHALNVFYRPRNDDCRNKFEPWKNKHEMFPWWIFFTDFSPFLLLLSNEHLFPALSTSCKRKFLSVIFADKMQRWWTKQHNGRNQKFCPSLPELWLVFCDDTDFNFWRLEVSRQNRR